MFMFVNSTDPNN